MATTTASGGASTPEPASSTPGEAGGGAQPSQPSDQEEHEHDPSALEYTAQLTQSFFTSVFSYIGEVSLLSAQAVIALLRRGFAVGDLLEQMAAVGIGTLPIALLTVFSSAAVITLYFSQFLISYGAGTLTGAVVALSMGRELAPVLVGVVAAARAGSSIAAEIGTMEVTEQVDALRALAVSPVQYLVVPRLLAALIMIPLVAIAADAFGLVGGYIVAMWKQVPPSSFATSISQFVEWRDFTLGIVKTIVFAFIVAIVSCHQGLKTAGGATGVGRSTTNAVVLSIVLIYISDFFLAYFMFGGKTNLGQ